MESHMDNKKVKIVFDGSTNVCNFLAKVELEASLKDYADEKKANFLASRLSGPAFDVYMRLTAENKKNFDEIKKELKKEFERGQLNREEALSVLSNRTRDPKESPHTFAYKLTELVKLAYPNFNDETRQTIAKDYFMKGVYPDMQVALKSRATFANDDITTLASETVRLALAGVKSYATTLGNSSVCSKVELAIDQTSALSNDTINSIADVVVAKLRDTSLGATGGNEFNEGGDGPASRVDNAVYRTGGPGRGGRRGQYSNRRNRGGRGGNSQGSQQKTCRACQATDHLIKDCPKKFCQACGQRGHNQYDRCCPNYT